MTSGGRLALGAFLVASLLAGGNAVGVRFSNRELSPLWGAGLRFAFASAKSQRIATHMWQQHIP